MLFCTVWFFIRFWVVWDKYINGTRKKVYIKNIFKKNRQRKSGTYFLYTTIFLNNCYEGWISVILIKISETNRYYLNLICLPTVTIKKTIYFKETYKLQSRRQRILVKNKCSIIACLLYSFTKSYAFRKEQFQYFHVVIKTIKNAQQNLCPDLSSYDKGTKADPDIWREVGKSNFSLENIYATKVQTRKQTFGRPKC